MTTTFSNYKFESDGKIVNVVHEANFVRRTIITTPLELLLKDERVVETSLDLKETYILKLSKKGTTFVLSVGKWGDYKEHVEGKATYEDSKWNVYIIGTKKFASVKDGETINTVFYSF